jgi:hypothetical protein
LNGSGPAGWVNDGGGPLFVIFQGWIFHFHLRPFRAGAMHGLAVVAQRLLGGTFGVANGEQVAYTLNCQPHDVATLVAARLLEPLGNPPPNSVKLFATVELLELVKDRG